MKIQFIKFLNTYGKSKVIVLTVLMLVVAHTHVASAATLKLPPTNLGLVGYWPMDEGAGSVVKDISGSKNNGTLTGGTTWTIGKLGSALSFNGVNNYASIPAFSSPSTVTDYSTSFWFYMKAHNSGGRSYLYDFRGDGTVVDGSAPLFLIDSSGSVLGILDAFTGTELRSSAVSVLTKWHHVAVTRISGTTNIYLDGLLVQSGNAGAGGNLGAAKRLGDYSAQNTSGGNYWFNGYLDDFRFYSRALSAAEVQQLYSAGVAKMNTSSTNKNTSGLVGLWTFDGADTTTTTATDKSGNGNNGTLVSSPAMVTGKMGQALNLNGLSQYVNAGSSATLNLSSWSAVMWIKPSSVSGATYQALLGGRYSVGYATLYLKGSKFGVYTDADHFGTASLLAGKWSQVVATFSGGTYKTYVNGVLDINTSYSASFGPNGGSVVMGVNPIALNSERFTGVIDDTRVYSRALSATEIQQLYNAGAGTQVNSAQVNTPSSSLATGLVGYWPFNGSDISGTTAYDRSTGGNNGTLVGSPIVTLGKMGQALKFSAASTQKVDFATKFPAITSAVTISTWVNPDATQVIYADIWGNHQDDFKGMDLQQNNAITNQYGWGYGNGTSWFGLSGQFNISANTWTHIVAVKDSTTCYVYLNGVEQSGIRGACSSAIAPATIMNFSVGRGYAGGGSRYFNGKIDDVRVYNRALSASEINQLYLLGK